MCNLYRITTSVEAMRRLFGTVGEPNLPPFGEIYPKRDAPIIRADEYGYRRVSIANWGVAGPADAKAPVTNIRNLDSPWWRTALANPERRCLVPVDAFCEWTVEPDPATGRKRKVWFEMCDTETFVFAGIAYPTAPDQPDRFAFLTCAPNTVVGAIHPKAMPVILHDENIDAWLAGAPPTHLAVPLADERMRVVG